MTDTNTSKVSLPNTALTAELSELIGVVEPASVAEMIMQRAFHHGVTDVHVDPTPVGVRIRFRVDGVLQDILPIPAETAAAVKSRMKVMAGMDITERRIPQDGHISSQQFDGIARDIRVSSLSTIYGERIVLRLMPDPNHLNQLEDLGFYDEQKVVVENLLRAPYGLLLVVGPVGAGKSTTVYSFLRRLNTADRSILTIEDPVERNIAGANQIQIDAKHGINFGTALRGALRQDPNILAVGEIRDAETAAIACRAAMTGVLVLSTLHASNASMAIEVLKQFDVPRLLIAEVLRGVISQRLMRRVSSADREAYSPEQATLDQLGLPSGQQVVRGLPNEKNFQTGYSGRTAIFEILSSTPTIQDAIIKNKSAQEIQRLAVEEGMSMLEQSARQQVLDHNTSIDELQRIIYDTRLQA